MRLTDLAPRWIRTGDRTHLGVSFACPHCRAVRVGVLFANPSDGGLPSPVVDHGLLRPVSSTGILLWVRTGTSFEDLSLSPSIDCEASGHWHGVVRDGEVT